MQLFQYQFIRKLIPPTGKLYIVLILASLCSCGQSEVERLAQLVGIEVYGGDAIIDSEGRFYIIDFNDWPSFSRCRDEAAEAIANCPLK